MIRQPKMNKALLLTAINLAARKSHDGKCGPFGAIVTRNGEIISEGWNQVVESRDPTAHAEIVAIRKACDRLDTHSLDDCEIYCSCEPCPMCMAAIYWARISAVYFASSAADAAAAGFDDAVIRNQLELPLEKRDIPIARSCREQGQPVFDAWIANPDRQVY